VQEVYESIRLSGLERNVEYLGTFIAWLVSNKLLDADLERSAGSAAARVRMQDLTGPEFLTTVLHGEFKPSHLNEDGRGFVEYYFVTDKYESDYRLCGYSGEDEWLLYDVLAPQITRAFQAYSNPRSRLKQIGAKILKFPNLRK
jgi:hypothetical protein